MREAFQRWASVGKVVVGLLLAVLVLNLLLQASNVLAPSWLPYRLAGSGFEQDISQRIEAAEGQYRDHTVKGDRPLCALIGLSGLREAADLKAMSHSAGSRCRYLGLSGAGGAIDTMVAQTHRLLVGTLRPDVAVVGLSEYLLVDPTPPQPGTGAAAESAWAHAVREGDMRLLGKAARDSLWFITRRRDVSGAVEEALLAIKQTMLRALGAEPKAVLNPLTDPWREMIRLELPEHPSAAALNDGVVGYGARHLYEPVSYTPERIGSQAKALVELISSLRERGATVMVVAMPEHSLLRERVPPVAMEALSRTLASAPGGSPIFVDLRAAVPDSGFANISHVNSEGRALVSQLLAAEIAKALPANSQPLMSRPAGNR